ncbi:MAG: hypothetical protein OXG04_13750 [Acidobacteria bacterium]|nr:hypothetical protein [Acidobacteriota bacterium]
MRRPDSGRPAAAPVRLMMFLVSGSFRGRNGRRRPGPPGLFVLAWATALAAVVSLAAQSDSSVARFLNETIGFSIDDLRGLDRGSAVIRSLDTPVRQELAHVGVIHLDVPPDEFVDLFRDIERFERGPGIPEIGRFGSPPRLEDLQSLTLPAEDVEELPKCRTGDCQVKLSAEALTRFRTHVDWSAADAGRQASELAREMVLDLVRAYQAEGNTALGAYVDDDDPLLVAEQFRALLASRDPLPAAVPELLDYLDDYPRGLPGGADEFFYWTVVDFGMKPTIRVNHVVIYPLAERPSTGIAYAIATKQLYASHYFHTTLELRFLVDRIDRAGRAASTLISVTRSRNDGMTGFRGLFLRPIIRRRSRDAVRHYLEHVRRQVERSASEAVPSRAGNGASAH